MTVLDRSELEQSPLADLHLIADQIGLEGYRRLRKADLIDAILGEPDAGTADGEQDDRKEGRGAPRTRPARSRRRGAGAEREAREPEPEEEAAPAAPAAATRSRRGRSRAEHGAAPAAALVEGVVEILGNGSAFLRVDPPEPSDDDVYISAAQVRRCELVSGDRVSGPVRTPRRSERYPSLIRIEQINGEAAETVAEGTRYDDLPASFPTERFALPSDDPTLAAIESLAPIGRGSRVAIVGAARAGKTDTLRRLLGALAGSEELEVVLVLAGVRPEEIAEWQQGPVAPAASLSFAASPDAQGHAVEGAVETAKRIASRGGHAVVLIDNLDGLHPHVARKALAAARNLVGGGSLTVIAVAARPFGGETTVIALDASRAGAGRLPSLDVLASWTARAELLVGEEGAEAIARAHAAAADAAADR